MTNSPNYEPRTSDFMTRQQCEDIADAAAAQARAEAYEHHINQACRAIQLTPIALVDSAYISQVIYTLSCRASDARMEEVADELGAVAMEIDARSTS